MKATFLRKQAGDVQSCESGLRSFNTCLYFTLRSMALNKSDIHIADRQF